MRRDILIANVGNFIAACAFGGAVVATRAAVKDVPPLSLAVLRFTQGGLLLLLGLLLFARGSLRIQRRDFPFLAFLGLVLFAIFPLAFNAGLRLTEASRGSLMLSTAPLWSAVLAWASRGEELIRRQVAGLVLTIVGVVIVLSERGLHWAGNARAFAGDGLMLVAALCGAIYAVCAKRAFLRYRPLTVTTYTMLIGTLILVPAALREGLIRSVGHLNGTTILLILYLGIPAGAIGWFVFIFSLTRLTPTQASVYINLNPLTAAILAALLLSERLTVVFIVGFAVVLAGVILVNMPARARIASQSEARLQPGT